MHAACWGPGLLRLRPDTTVSASRKPLTPPGHAPANEALYLTPSTLAQGILRRLSAAIEQHRGILCAVSAVFVFFNGCTTCTALLLKFLPSKLAVTKTTLNASSPE